jgi:hypothetical protein
VTLAHRHAALWQAPLILTTHATALLRLATARHPSAPTIPKLLVVTAARTHACLLLLQRSHHYTRWTSLRTSRVPGQPTGPTAAVLARASPQPPQALTGHVLLASPWLALPASSLGACCVYELLSRAKYVVPWQLAGAVAYCSRVQPGALEAVEANVKASFIHEPGGSTAGGRHTTDMNAMPDVILRNDWAAPKTAGPI